MGKVEYEVFMITFEAEITEIKVKKTVSNDKEFKLVLLTNDSKVLELQEKIANDTITITIE
jgi:hypothetical protein